MNTIGQQYKVTLLGASHDNMVGVVIEGIPAGTVIDLNEINEQLSYRRPGQSRITTARKETDKAIIRSGMKDGKSTGAPLFVEVENNDVQSNYYDEIRLTPRPGHSDYPAYVKYDGFNDYRGGGQFSGRMTIGLVIAGTIAQQILSQKAITVAAYTQSIGDIAVNRQVETIDKTLVYDDSNPVRTIDRAVITPMEDLILSVKKEGDSIGGTINCIITGIPVGVGEPIFGSIESEIAHMMFSIPAIKGIEFGEGFHASKMRGSEHNDEFTIEDGMITTRSNHAGGILGGLATGQPITFTVAVKPTSSISRDQQTVDMEKLTKVPMKVRGRHDPCIVPRAVPVIEHATACTILDLMFRGGFL